jgi:phage terminase large subunit-like protein
MAHKQDVLRLLEAQVAAKRTHRMLSFAPYERQVQFFEMGATKRERLLMAGTQVGKSEAGAYEAACHLTGRYPRWWAGARFDHPVKAWAAGEGGALVRDIIQGKLCGTPGSEEAFGTGMIPRALLLGKSASHGVSDAYDNIKVRHASGGVSTLHFKSYDQGRAKFQSATLDFVWLDEEAPIAIYSECLARLTGEGVCYVTFTPLEGYTQTVSRFLRDDSPDARRDRGVVRMGLRHAKHFTEEEKERRLAGYPAHERAARENGDPMLGSGAVFEEVIESDLSTRLAITDVPPHWAKLWGVDFGIAHPFAAVLAAWDKDADVFYVLDAFKMSGGVPSGHASRMNAIARGVPVSYPHDGAAREKASGQALATIYRNEGLNMLGSHATHVGGGYSTEAGVLEMLTRMRDGRFKVASHLSDWFEEFRSYHRKDGQIVKLNDDILSATRIAVTARRHAKAGNIGRGHQHSNYGFGGPIRSRVVPSFNPLTGRAYE